MWNTPQELSNRISALEKEVEKFSQNLEPKDWYYEWQLWFDKIEKKLKVWDWSSYANIAPEGLKYYQERKTTWTWVYSWGDYTITTGFRPKHISILATEANEWVSVWFAWEDENGVIQNGCHYRDWNYTSLWVTDWTSCIAIKRSVATAWYVKSISDTWFVLNINNNNYNFDTVITAVW